MNEQKRLSITIVDHYTFLHLQRQVACQNRGKVLAKCAAAYRSICEMLT